MVVGLNGGAVGTRPARAFVLMG